MKNFSLIIGIVVVLVIIAVFILLPGERSIAFEFSNLPELYQGHYGAWLISGGERINLGKFNSRSSVTFSVPNGVKLDRASGVSVTIQPGQLEEDTSDSWSGIEVLTGSFVEDSAVLNFPIDFSKSSGAYFLATPTNGNDSDETSGIWFARVPGPTRGLELPSLVNIHGWMYEGWVEYDGRIISTGRFYSANGLDSSNEFSATDVPPPPYPGEDFLEKAPLPLGLTFPIDLADGTGKAFISLEPDINGVDPTGDRPFAIQFLKSDIPFRGSDHANYLLELNLESVPSGRAVMN